MVEQPSPKTPGARMIELAPKRWLLTAGGSIHCLRCTAISKRTRQQCGRPALVSSRHRKCQFHGGRSTGPITNKGRVAVARAHLLHGRETREQRTERAAKAAELKQLGDIARLVGLISGRRPPGRNPNAYTPIRTLEDALRFRDAHPVPRVWPRKDSSPG